MPLKLTNQNTGLTIQQEKAIQMLATGMEGTEVAEVLKVNKCTVYRWMKDSRFKQALNVKSEEFSQELLYIAIGQLREILLTARPKERLKAIELVLTLNGRLRTSDGQSINFIQNNREVSIEDILSELDNMA